MASNVTPSEDSDTDEISEAEEEEEGDNEEDEEKESGDEEEEKEEDITKPKPSLEGCVFKHIPIPFQVDLKLEFGDKEIFLVDGDSLIFSILTTPNLVPWSSSPALGCSSLHLIYLVEKSLRQFVDRGGRPQLVFFKEMGRMWLGANPAIALLREIVVRHFGDNVEATGVSVITGFRSAVDPEFRSYLREESVLMVCLTSPGLELRPMWGCNEERWNSTKAIFHYLIVLTLGRGVNVSLLDQAQVTVATINGYHLYKRKMSPNLLSKMADAYVDRLESFPSLTPEEVREEVVNDPYHHLVREVMRRSRNALEHEVRELVSAFLLYIALSRTKTLLNKNLLPGPNLQIECKKDSTLARLVQGLYGALFHLVHVLPLQDIPQLMSPWFMMRLIYCHREQPERYEEILNREDVQDELKKLNRLDRDNTTLRASLNVKRIPVRVIQESRALYTIDNHLFSKYLGGDVELNPDFPRNDPNKVFEERYHWHVMKPISEEYSRDSETSGKAQKYANYMTKYGASIEGEIESNQTIVVERGAREKNAGKVKRLSKKGEEIRRDNVAKKCGERLEALKKNDQMSEDRKVKELKDVLKQVDGMVTRDERGETIAKDCNKELMSLYLKRALASFAVLKSSGFKDVGKEAIFLRDVRNILQADYIKHGLYKTLKIKQLATCLTTLGYSEFALNSFPPEDCPAINLADQRSIVHFQLEHMGQHLELERPDTEDPRIRGFVPDEWQRRLFDAIDNRQSALIIAPTSSGKTYASYYCMEQVLRESDEGVVVYVAPTKALVNQVAATVYARFGKSKRESQHIVYGVFTRDYRFNTKHCQVLVTVPACLEILLFSPSKADWCDRLRYVIFDEVHNIGAEGDASAWEHTLLMIRCPFLALSATVANPGDLHRWMENLEKIKEVQDKELGCPRNEKESYKVELVEYGERHADLVKYVYRANEDEGEKKKPSLESNLSTVHPLSLVKVKDVVDKKNIPRHIALSAKESLQLFKAMAYVLGLNQVSDLEPSRYFSEKFISRNEVSRYSLSMFQRLENLEESLLRQVVQRLPGHPEEMSGRKDFLDLLQILKAEKMLPALVFVYDRELCVDLPIHVMEALDQELDSLPQEKRSRPVREDDDGRVESEKEERVSKREKMKFAKNSSAAQVIRKITVERRSKPVKVVASSSFSAMEHLTEISQGNGVTFAEPRNLDGTMAEFLREQLALTRETNDEFVHCLQLGVSWHHSGNKKKLKMVTEMLFRCGFLNLVVATTTLAQGIHMPCKTVIFFADSLFLNTLSYHQCSGRAGRRGFDTQGNVIFFNIPRPKISRLVTSPLPMLLGNEPIRLTLILRILIFAANIKMEGRKEFDVHKFAVEKVLCLLRGPLILQVRPEMEPQLRHFFMFGVDYLARQGYLDRSGNPIGFSGLASHLHYLEPFNFAFCHLLREGRLHKLCRRDRHGNFSAKTMEELLLVVSTLFGRKRLHMGLYEYKKRNKLFHNSKVLLEKLPADLQQCLREFNRDMERTFSNFLRYIATRTTSETCLPLSRIVYRVPEDFREVYSVFSSSETSKEDAINGLFSNANANIFTSFLPLVDLDTRLNRYVLDCFHHRTKKDLVRDNGLKESELYNSLEGVYLVIRAISTSLCEIGPSSLEDVVDDELVGAFQQLAEEFKEAMGQVFPEGRWYLKKGCVRIHGSNCVACDHMEEGEKVKTLSGRRSYFVRGFGLSCRTRSVIYVLKCLSCGKLYVGESLRCLQDKVRSFVDKDGSGNEVVRRCFEKGHKMVLQVVDTYRSEREMVEKRLVWQGRLRAQDRVI